VPASPLDNAFLQKVRENYPSPIAQAARRFQAANEDARLTEAVNLAKTLMLTLGTISLAWCEYRQIRPDGVQHWHDRFQRSAPTLGDWLGAARAGAKLASEIGAPLSGLETALGGEGGDRLWGELEALLQLRNRYAHGNAGQTTATARLARHLRTSLEACGFLARTKFVIIEGNDPQRSGGFRIVVRAVAGDNQIFLPAPTFQYPKALYAETLYLLQEPGDHLEIAPFWVVRKAKGDHGWELFYLNKRVGKKRGFHYLNFFRPDDSFVDYDLPQALHWFDETRRSAKRFRRAPSPESLLDPGGTILPPDRVDLAGLHRRTMASMMEAMSFDEATGDKGWSHHLGLRQISPVGTAFGLRIMRLVDWRFSLFRSDEILETIWRQRLPDGCWRSMSQLPTGRPEATSAVLLAFCEQEDWARAREVHPSFERLLEPGRDPALWTYVSSLALAVPALSTIAPESPLLGLLVQSLEDSAVRDDRGRIVFWTPYSRQAGLEGEPSAAHTARVLLALQHLRDATDRRLGLPMEELAAAVRWLLAQPRWENLHEELRRPIGADRSEVLTIRHFTRAWVVRALLEFGIDPEHERIRATIREIYTSHDQGLWNWNLPGGHKIPRPGWATFDALRALESYVLRAGQF
jgi:hypothetical protein